MSLHGVEVPGDADVMLRVLVEEYARIGWDLESLMELSSQPFYRALYALRQRYGEPELRRRIGAILARCGVMRTTTPQTNRPGSTLPSGGVEMRERRIPDA